MKGENSVKICIWDAKQNTWGEIDFSGYNEIIKW